METFRHPKTGSPLFRCWCSHWSPLWLPLSASWTGSFVFWGPTPKKKCEKVEHADTMDQISLTEALDAKLELSALCDLLGEESRDGSVSTTHPQWVKCEMRPKGAREARNQRFTPSGKSKANRSKGSRNWLQTHDSNQKYNQTRGNFVFFSHHENRWN